MIDIRIGDCLDLIKDIKDNSIDLIVTSPPYSDIVKYGKQFSVLNEGDYINWLLSLFVEVERVLKPSGSFILNINDKCVNGYRSTYIYDLISRNNKETKLKLYDTYFWYKKNGLPSGRNKRIQNRTEFLFHFCKDKNKLKIKLIKEAPSASTVSKNNGVVRPIAPDNIFRFSSASAARDNTIKHPAPFHKDLPLYFIKTLTDKNDVVLDPFSGIGTTGLACKESERDYIGFELNKDYAEFSIKRINGDDISVEVLVGQYDLDNNFIKHVSVSECIDIIKEKCPSYTRLTFLQSIQKGIVLNHGGYRWDMKINNNDGN